jgi:hypothetical protein
VIKITRVITADDPFGEPWPPHSTHSWHVAHRSRDFTVWRAIEVVQPEPPPAGAQSTYGGNRNCSSK